MDVKLYDYVIVGAGLFGATFAHFATKQGKKCLVIDRRSQLGGNLYCENVEGLNVHKYGAHIFHTSSKRVWDFVNSLVEFNRFTNAPVANYKGKLYNLPFNMNTFYQMWSVTTPEEAQAKLDEQRAEAVARIKAEGVEEPRNLEEQALALIGKDVYEKLIKGYTEKQWGRKCTELPSFIIKRLPVRLVYDNNYFNDKYQGIPIGGYNKLIDALLDGVETIMDIDFFDCQHTYDTEAGVHKVQSSSFNVQCEKIVFTGKIDEYFGYRLGKLDYRTVRFEHEVLNVANYQGNAVVNYTEAQVPYTRIIEHKHFESFGQEVYANPKTVISREYSTEWQEGMEPYYPVNDEKNNQLAKRYRLLAAEESGVIFGGRLAEYKYYDMAPIVEQVMRLFP
ncbi:UDP-galactopyranose mutase [Prevotella fusca]|uniref:UDP-galactopyranose mutase n=1 Tax=Prevotella fusca TaxID=589436 RepID=UPI003FA02894